MSSRRVVPFRRKREGKTNYHKRLELLKSRKPRIVIRKTLKHIIAQIFEYQPAGDKVIVFANSKELSKLGWEYDLKNVPSAYLVGVLLAKKAIEKNITEAILDFGMARSIPKSKLYATAKGLIDGGMKIPCSEEVFPDENRLNGTHIADYSKKLNDESQKIKFSGYAKKNLDISKMPQVFEQVKAKIKG